MAQTGYTPIQLYYSTTAAAVPTAGNLANGELAINITDGKLYYKNNSGVVTLIAGSSAGPAGGSNTQVQYNSSGVLAGSANMTFDGTTLTLGANPILSGGTANGVAYLNGSKAVTSGSALTFDGSRLGVGVASPGFPLDVASISGETLRLRGTTTTGVSQVLFTSDTAGANYAYLSSASGYLAFGMGASSEQMRLTSTGLGIGTSSPSGKLHVVGRSYFQPATAQTTAITLMNTSGGDGNIQVTGTSTTMNYSFNTYSTAAALYIQNDGSVGIGTSSPGEKLDVAGSVYVRGDSSNATFTSPGQLAIKRSTGDPVFSFHGNTGAQIGYLQWQDAGNCSVWVGVNQPLLFGTNATERLRIAANGAWGLAGANYGTSGQVLTSNGSGSAPTWQNAGGGGGSAATPTVQGTVYGTMSSSASSNLGLGYAALVSITSGSGNTAVGYSAGDDITTGTQNTIVGYGAYGAVSTASYNSAFGYQALAVNTSGTQNAAFGWLALQKNTTGGGNVSLGAYSMHENASGGSNTAIGFEALGTVTNSSADVAIGYQALALANPAVSGYNGYNVAIGYKALYSAGTVAGNSTGACVAVGYQAGYSTSQAGNGATCTFIGSSAGYSNVSGYGNTFIGANAGYGQTSGDQNICIGYSTGRQTAGSGGGKLVAIGNGAGQANSGNDNTFVGVGAGQSNAGSSQNAYFGTYAGLNATGGNNVALGFSAMYSTTSAANNVAVGSEALRSMTSASGSHVAVGYQALYSATDNSNSALGYRAGYGVTSGHNNVLLGANAGNSTVVLAGGAQNVVIGSGAYTNTTGAYNEIVIGQGCNGVGNDYVSIGKLNLRVYCHYDTNATWTQSSDVRLKKDIEDDSLGLSFINKLRPVKYRWKATNELEKDNPHYNEVNNKNTTAVIHGLIAQEVKAALDEEGVSTFEGWTVEPNGIQGISREMFITPLINAVQELTAQVETLKAEIAALKGNV